MADENTFQEAVNSIKNGDHERAKELLTGLLKRDKNNPEYWLWLSTVVESHKERVFCLESVLRLDPENKAAKRGLTVLGARPAGEEINPVPPVRRKWTLEPVAEPPSTWIGRIMANPVLRVVSILIVLLVLAGLITIGIFGFRYTQQITFVKVSITPRPTLTPTITYTPSPTATRVVRTPTPTFSGPIPLWTLLESTYTPTPRYVDTPHPILEAYRSSMRAFERGDLEQMILFLQQAIRDDPQAADFHYYIGVANLIRGRYETASEAYQKAIGLNPNFAPAYTGYAKALFLLDPEENSVQIEENYGSAIDLDPEYFESYLGRAEYYLSLDQLIDAREDLDVLTDKDLRDPRLYLLLAKLDFIEEDYESALQNAEKAYAIDLTLPDVYLILAEVYARNKNYKDALEKIDIYLPFDDTNPRAWFLMGQARFETGDKDQALQALDEALRLDNRNGEAYWYRGRIFLEQDEGQKAVNELYTASLILTQSFEVNLDLARALSAADRIEDALQQFTVAEGLAETNTQKAELLYWRGQVLEAGGNPGAAVQVYLELMAIPEEDLPGDYLQFAQERLFILNPPTATATATSSLTPTSTRTSTSTPKLSATPSRTATRTPLPTRTPTSTITP